MFPHNIGFESTSHEVVSVDTPFMPYDHHFDAFQTFYRHGIRVALQDTRVVFNDYSLSRFPLVLRLLRRVRHSFKFQRLLGRFEPIVSRWIDRFAKFVGGETKLHKDLFHPLVGMHVFHMANGSVKNVCIDAQDGGEVSSTALLNWSDLYFKTNYWESLKYDSRILPLFNSNPLLLGYSDHLRSLRTVKPIYDLCFIVRVWGGADEVSGIEHNLRLLEPAAKCNCRRFIVAYLVAGNIPEIARRLERQGIPWRSAPIKLTELWEISARSKLNMIRLGMHSCLPWRMADLLAMGACPLLDQPPKSKWPIPLAEYDHFLNLGAVVDQNTFVACDRHYDRIPSIIKELLSEEGTLKQIRENNIEYFDRHLAPGAVGEYVSNRVKKLHAEPLANQTGRALTIARRS
jgi:hypothetical protein